MLLYIEAATGYVRDALRTMRRQRLAADRAEGRRPGPLERRPPAPDEAHGVDPRRLLELVPRRARPQHRPVAADDRRVPPRDEGVRPGGVRRPQSAVDEVLRRAGGRDHRRRVGHRAGAGCRPRPTRRAARALRDVDAAGLDETVDLAKSAGVREVRSDVVDVASRTAIEAWASDVVGQFGRVNVLVNNAGVSLTGEVVDLDVDDMEWIVGINFWGVVHGTRAFLPHLIASGDGHVVTMSSLFGLLSIPGQSLYNATKYAVRGFSESLREEMLVAGHPVGVTVVHPGGIKTAIVRNAGGPRGARTRPRSPRMFDERLAKMPPERAAEIILRGVLRGKPRVLVGLDAHVAAPVRADRRRPLPGRRGPPGRADAAAAGDPRSRGHRPRADDQVGRPPALAVRQPATSAPTSTAPGSASREAPT